MAQVIRKSDGRVLVRKAATFESRRKAEQWIRQTEKLVENPESFIEQTRKRATVADAIRQFAALRKRPLGKTQTQLQNTILKLPIASRPTTVLDAVDIVNFARDLGKDRSPSTVSTYVSFLGEALRTAQGLGFPLDINQIETARHTMGKLGLIAASNERDRRPTLDEIDALMAYFAEQSKSIPDIIPMERLIAFAIFSCRRQTEVTEMKWVDLDLGDENRPARWTVHQMKDPRKKLTNTVRTIVPPRALAIALAMPRDRDGPFTYKPDSISARFTRACKILGIRDLTFHDLRHEGTSHLFELRQQIPEVATVTGHKSWQTLKRYAHIEHFHDRYAKWPWFEHVNTPLILPEVAPRPILRRKPVQKAKT
ncbi:MAG: site-specific integrase [Sphingopyxis sp.]|nr:site-specific integrase [Sphingopyxis sp.]